MAKLIRTKRVRFDRRIAFTAMRRPNRINFRSEGAYNAAMQNWRASMAEHTYHNVHFALTLLSRVVFVVITIGFIFVLWNRSFEAQDFASNLVQQDFAPFDYQEFIQLVDDSFDNLPSWMSGLKGLSQIVVSLGYTFFWLFGLVKYLIVG